MGLLRRLTASPLIPAALLVAAGVVQYKLWMERAGDRTEQILSVWMVWLATAILLTVWWLVLSAVRWRIRLGVLLAIGATAGLFLLVFRCDGVSGELIPQFSFRWRPTSEERAVAYFEQQAPVTTVTALRPVAPATLTVDEGDWPEFRGPNRDGIVRGVRIRRDWDENPPQALWRHPVGPAWSSFAVVGHLAFTQEQRGEEETVVCYDLETGAEVWTHADAVRFSTATGGVGPLSTPTVADGRVFTVGPTGNLKCLDALTGRLLWRRDILKDAGMPNVEWGNATSPLVWHDRVMVHPGGDIDHTSSLSGYHVATGEPVFSEGISGHSYSSPVLRTIHGYEFVLVRDAIGLAAHDPRIGGELWHISSASSAGINPAAPFIRSDGMVVLSTGYGIGAALFKITPPPPGGLWKARLAENEDGWGRRAPFKLKFNDGIQRGDIVYGLDEGVLACFDLMTGRRTWKSGRYGYGQLLWIEEEDLLLVMTEQGEAVLLEVTPKTHREVARFQALDGKTWNHPVLVRGKLLVRNAAEAACYDLRPTPPKIATR